MRKMLSILACICGVILILIGIVSKLRGGFSTSYIGGADGPTAIFVAGKTGSGVTLILIGIGILLLVIAGLVAFVNRK